MFGIESLKGADDIYSTVVRIPKRLFTRSSCKQTTHEDGMYTRRSCELHKGILFTRPSCKQTTHEDGIYTRRSCELYKGIILHDRDVWNSQYTRVGATHRCLCRVKNMLAMYLRYHFRYIVSIFLTLHKHLWATLQIDIHVGSYSSHSLVIYER